MTTDPSLPPPGATRPRGVRWLWLGATVLLVALLRILVGGSEPEPLHTARLLAAAVCNDGDAALRDLFRRHLDATVELDLGELAAWWDVPASPSVSRDVALDRLLIARRRLTPCSLELQHPEVVPSDLDRARLIAQLFYSRSAERLHAREFRLQARFQVSSPTLLTGLRLVERGSGAPEPRP